MTDQPDLATTLHELLNPRVEIVQRDQADADTAAAEAAHAAAMTRIRAQHQAEMVRLRAQTIDALSRPRQAVQARRRALAQLIECERRWQASVEARATARGELPSRLDQLAELDTSSTGAGAPGVHRIPLNLPAAELLAHIEREVGHRGQPRLKLAAAVWTWSRTAPAELAARLAAHWLAEARAILEPQRPIPVHGACPVCTTRTVYVDDAGDRVRRAAIQLDRTTGQARCTAQGCDATWAPDQLAHLGLVLDQQAEEERAERERQAGDRDPRSAA